MLLLLWIATMCRGQDASADLNRQVAELRDLVLKLQTRIDDLEKRSAGRRRASSARRYRRRRQWLPAAPPAPGLFENTTINFAFDGYYGFNFNSPIGRTNLLRAYDVSSNSFSLNQADVVIENAADPAQGRHFGARVDLQFGQATQTLQGSAMNEPRPDIYRNIFQAYGTWAPNNKLTLDFGKWSSSIGLEGNYTKDQINYSRSYLFDFLPFYHMGVRAAYKVNDALTVNYWLDNGTQQTEAFNNYQGRAVRLRSHAAQEYFLDGQLLSGPGASRRGLFSLHQSAGAADAARRILRADHSRAAKEKRTSSIAMRRGSRPIN